MYGQGKTRGKVALLRIPAAMNQACAAIEVGNQLDGQYLLFYLASRYEEIRSMSNAGSQENLSGELVRRIPIALPPIREQRAIADLLGDVDDLTAELDLMITKKQAIKQGIMQQLLTGRARLPGFTSGAWEARPLRQDVTLISGNHVMAKDCNTQRVGTPYLTGPADFPQGRIRHTKFTTRPAAMCRAGDVLVTVKGSGSGSIVVADAEYCISRQLMAVRPSEWDSRFLFYSLLHNASRIKAASTGLIPGLSRSDILKQLLPVPPTVEEQRAIAAVVEDADGEIDLLRQRLAKAQLVKIGMTQELLTGRTRLPAQGETEA